jgi:4-carboxymuconolactone decarboxylase
VAPSRPTRIPPVPPEERDEEFRDLMRRATGSPDRVLNIFATLARNRRVMREWLKFGSAVLFSGSIPERQRELAILRTGYRCDSEYEWGQHVVIGLRSGVAEDEIPRIIEGPGASGWSELDAAVLRAVDELHDDSVVGDATWDTLSRHYDHAQMIELVMLIGQYHLVAFTLNSCGVQRDPGVPGFPD